LAFSFFFQGSGKFPKLYQDMVNGTTEFSKWFFREGIEVVESEWLPGQAPFDRLTADLVTTVETFCFFLRHLPFGFLTLRIRGAFPPYSVGGILVSLP
jgi:hypothetical protein